MSLYLYAAIAAAVLFALLAIQVYRVVVGYRAATGTRWQKFLAAFSHSHTVFVARLGTIGAAMVAFTQTLLPLLDPGTQVGAAVQQLLDPKYVPFYFLGFSLLVEYMRKRQSSIDPILPPPQAVIIPPSPVVAVPTPATYPAGEVVPNPAVPPVGGIIDTHV